MKNTIDHLTEYQKEVLWVNLLEFLMRGLPINNVIWNQAVAVVERMKEADA